MNSFLEINDSTYQSILEKEKTVLLIFSSTNCGYCQIAKNNLKKVITNFPELKVYEYIIDKNYLLIEKYKISSIPIMILFANGKVVHRFFGIRQEDDLYYQLKSFFPRSNDYIWPE